MTIAFEQGDDVKVGDIVDYRATTQKPGYLAIFDATPDGKLTQIYPNALSLRSPTGALESTRMDPSQPVVVPNYKNPYRGFNVRITEPRGEGTMVAVLSEKPISALDTPDKPKTFATPQAARAAIRRIHDELARNLGVVGSARDMARRIRRARRAARTYQGGRRQRGHIKAGAPAARDMSRQASRDIPTGRSQFTNIRSTEASGSRNPAAQMNASNLSFDVALGDARRKVKS